MKKTDLMQAINISPNTLARLSKNENVSMEIIDRICSLFNCDVGDIVEHEDISYASNRSLGTFLPNKNEQIHGWFGYLEGYSKKLVENELEKLNGVSSILDPFSGSGTTPLVGVMNGINSYFCESNPVMQFISETKVLTVKRIVRNPDKIKLFNFMVKKFLEAIDGFTLEGVIVEPFDGFEKYFEEDNLKYIQFFKKYINNVQDPDIRALFRIALAGVAVPTSKMIRRGDLRFAKRLEIQKTNKNFRIEIRAKLENILSDLQQVDTTSMAEGHFLGNDARKIQSQNLVDAIITSPPYLNGTNYIRNTKLELKLLDFIESEKDLAHLHSVGIIAGINNVSRKKGKIKILPIVQPILDKLYPVSYDKRIPLMIAGYFRDMNDVFNCLSKVLKNKGSLIMDIGDSQFAGVHVPTHDILISLANDNGFKLYSNEIIRSRRSKSGFELTQRILRFQLGKDA